MPKEKNYNPVQAQRKADKAKAIKKGALSLPKTFKLYCAVCQRHRIFTGKADVAAKRNERLAKRNPEQIKKQIDDLKAITEGGGKLSAHEQQVLEGLEKELKAVNKARETLGDAAPQFRHHGPPRDGVLGKRRRDFHNDADSSSDSDIPDDVKSIPMPRDTPPPISKEIMDEWWAKRRAKRNANASSSTNANVEPLGRDRGIGGQDRERSQSITANSGAPVEAKVVYESKPIVRDLKKEAAVFVPAAVRVKIDKSQGKGGLMEPEEADKLEQEGYLRPGEHATPTEADARRVTMEEVEDDED